MAGNQDMSIEEVLAACRRMDGCGDGEVDAAPESAAAREPQPEAGKPAAKAATGESATGESATGKSATGASGGKKASEMSVAEVLAATRVDKSGGAKPAAIAPAKKPAAKASPKPAPAKKPGGPKDTASILAAARATGKPGPISKSEAAARGQAPAAKEKKKELEVPPMPAKPEYARAMEASAPAAQEDRRSFVAALAGVFVGSSLAVGFSSLVVTHVLWVLGMARFMFPNILTEPPTQFTVGFSDALAPGQVQTKYKAQFGVWIVRYEYDGQPQIYALQSVCTHLGCTPNWLEGEQKFKCPCHGSGFYKDGINFEGPAPRPLERFAIRIADDGQIEVDKSRTFKEEMGQWGDGASFVPV
jgi:cytochrome b6-f complex iron-sulfur subunit